MKTLYILTVITTLLCLSMTMLSAQDYDLFEKYQHPIERKEAIPYRLLMPQNYDAAKKYPVILFLHGAGERGDDNEAQLIHGVKTFLTEANRADFPCIVVAPQCPVDSYWGSVAVDRSQYPVTLDFDYSNEMTYALAGALEILDQIIEGKSVDQDRIYITGLSMGGMGTFEAVYKRPEFFAAAAPICGGGDLNAYANFQTDTPFWIFHGEVDQVVAVKNSRNLYNILLGQDIDVQYTEYPGVNHDSWNSAYDEAKLLPWMFAQSRKK